MPLYPGLSRCVYRLELSGTAFRSDSATAESMEEFQDF